MSFSYRPLEDGQEAIKLVCGFVDLGATFFDTDIDMGRGESVAFQTSLGWE